MHTLRPLPSPKEEWNGSWAWRYKRPLKWKSKEELEGVNERKRQSQRDGEAGPKTRKVHRENTHTSRIILDGGQLGTRPNALRGIEKAGLCGRDEADDKRAVWVDVRDELCGTGAYIPGFGLACHSGGVQCSAPPELRFDLDVGTRFGSVM